ncbi:MAG: hypothetical protein ACI4W2_04820 [Eubacterium sp.]
MIRRFRAGESLADIGRRMGVSAQYVSSHIGWYQFRHAFYPDPAPALREKIWYRSKAYPGWEITHRIWAEDYGDGMYEWWGDYTAEGPGCTKIFNSLGDAANYVKEEDNGNN